MNWKNEYFYGDYDLTGASDWTDEDTMTPEEKEKIDAKYKKSNKITKEDFDSAIRKINRELGL